MRTRLFGAGLFFVFMLACNHSEYSENSTYDINGQKGTAKIQFEKTEHDFGKVIEGEQVGWFFSYTNTGDGPLIIRRASATCGCTVPDFDKKPLAPGEKGQLKVVYDSRGRSGKDFKTVTVETNAENRIVKLNLKAEVITQ
ncbi:MAG: DUF1573 domain-containing protein [Bacteroidota bacterium]